MENLYVKSCSLELILYYKPEKTTIWESMQYILTNLYMMENPFIANYVEHQKDLNLKIAAGTLNIFLVCR